MEMALWKLMSFYCSVWLLLMRMFALAKENFI